MNRWYWLYYLDCRLNLKLTQDDDLYSFKKFKMMISFFVFMTQNIEVRMMMMMRFVVTISKEEGLLSVFFHFELFDSTFTFFTCLLPWCYDVHTQSTVLRVPYQRNHNNNMNKRGRERKPPKQRINPKGGLLPYFCSAYFKITHHPLKTFINLIIRWFILAIMLYRYWYRYGGLQSHHSLHNFFKLQ